MVKNTNYRAATACQFTSPRSKYSHKHPVLRHPQCSLSRVGDRISHPYKITIKTKYVVLTTPVIRMQ
jgi:hypothetical protein